MDSEGKMVFENKNIAGSGEGNRIRSDRGWKEHFLKPTSCCVCFTCFTPPFVFLSLTIWTSGTKKDDNKEKFASSTQPLLDLQHWRRLLQLDSANPTLEHQKILYYLCSQQECAVLCWRKNTKTIQVSHWLVYTHILAHIAGKQR